jgi:hypothetical protein
MWKTILLLVVLWWLWRFIYRMGRHARRRRPGPDGASRRRDEDRAYGDLTRQDISDADFEEIP